MADNTIFNQENSHSSDNEDNSNNANNDNNNSNSDTGALSDYIGPGKKYATVEEAVKSVDFAQNHIAKLEGENNDLRSKAYQGDAVREILAKIEANKNAGNEQTKGLSVEDISKLFETKLNQHTEQKTATENLQSVDKKMKAKFGDQAQKQMVQKASQLGMSLDDMRKTAERSPNAFMAWFGTSDQNASNQNANLDNDINTENMEHNSEHAKIGTYKYYKQMFKADPKKRLDPKVQKEMMDNAIRMGDAAFYA